MIIWGHYILQTAWKRDFTGIEILTWAHRKSVSGTSYVHWCADAGAGGKIASAVRHLQNYFEYFKVFLLHEHRFSFFFFMFCACHKLQGQHYNMCSVHVCICICAHACVGGGVGSIHTGLPGRIFHKKGRDVFIHACFIPSNARVCSSIFIAHIAYVDLTAICWEQKANATCKLQFQLWYCAFWLYRQTAHWACPN